MSARRCHPQQCSPELTAKSSLMPREYRAMSFRTPSSYMSHLQTHHIQNPALSSLNLVFHYPGNLQTQPSLYL